MALVQLDVVPDVGHVRVARLVAVSLARVNGVDEEVVEDVRLAVGEACGRAVAAHSRAALDEPVRLRFEGDADAGPGMRVEIVDRVAMPEADGEAALALLVGGQAPAAARAGAGAASAVMALLEGLADEVQVHTGTQGTTVELRWND